MRSTTVLTLLVALVSARPEPISKAVPKGKKIQYVGHSFHWLFPEPVAALAKEAGIVGHQTIGVDRIGASEPCQHWNKGGDTNAVKEVLKAGTADVLTLATRDKAPDPCIPKFVELAASKRSDINVMVQETWIVQSAQPDIEECTDWGCKTRNAATYEMIEKTRTKLEIPYMGRLREQMAGLNKGLGKNTTSLVPIYSAVLSLRQMIVKGQLPGVSKQTDLFRDDLGHAKKPLADMGSYMWFAALYGINPQGMKALAAGSPPEQTTILQKLAWDTLKAEPLNGLS